MLGRAGVDIFFCCFRPPSFLRTRGDESEITAGERQKARSLFFLFLCSQMEVSKLLSPLNCSLIIEWRSFRPCYTLLSPFESALVYSFYIFLGLSASPTWACAGTAVAWRPHVCDTWFFLTSEYLRRAFMYSYKFTGRAPSLPIKALMRSSALSSPFPLENQSGLCKSNQPCFKSSFGSDRVSKQLAQLKLDKSIDKPSAI